MKHLFFFNPTVTIELNDADFDLLMTNMSSHYDSTVQFATKLGGFMYGAKGVRDYDPSSKDLELSNRQLQLLIKSLEMNTSDESLKLSSELWKILKEMTDVTKRVNSQHISENLITMLNSLSFNEITQDDFESHINVLMSSSYYDDKQKNAFKGVLEISKQINAK